MEVKTLAATLLAIRLIAIIIIFVVIWKQVRIVRTKPDPELRAGRIVLMTMVLLALVNNVIPAIIDVLVLMDEVARNHPQPAGIVYAISNDLGDVSMAGAILALYIIAERLLNKGR